MPHPNDRRVFFTKISPTEWRRTMYILKKDRWVGNTVRLTTKPTNHTIFRAVRRLDRSYARSLRDQELATSVKDGLRVMACTIKALYDLSAKRDPRGMYIL